MRIEHTIDIAAPVERVWDLTLDVEAWPEHTPTMTSVERLDDGPLEIGSRATVRQPRQGAKVWTVEVLEPGRRFAWSTKALGCRMTGSHTLEPNGTGTRNVLAIELEGWSAGLLGRLIGGQIRKAIGTENDGFKRAAEAAPVS